MFLETMQRDILNMVNKGCDWQGSYSTKGFVWLSWGHHFAIGNYYLVDSYGIFLS
jgi:hypothetical protein